MTPTDIKRLRELCEKATPGPWDRMWELPAFSDADDAWLSINCTREDDANFIVASRTALPALLDEVERLQATIRQLEKDHREDMRDAYAEGMWSEREYNDKGF